MHESSGSTLAMRQRPVGVGCKQRSPLERFAKALVCESTSCHPRRTSRGVATRFGTRRSATTDRRLDIATINLERLFRRRTGAQSFCLSSSRSSLLSRVVDRMCLRRTASSTKTGSGWCASSQCVYASRRPEDRFVVGAGVEQRRGRDGAVEAVGRRDRGGRGRRRGRGRRAVGLSVRFLGRGVAARAAAGEEHSTQRERDPGSRPLRHPGEGMEAPSRNLVRARAIGSPKLSRNSPNVQSLAVFT